MRNKKISNAAVGRIVLYYRTLKNLEQSGEKIISSGKLSKLLEFTPEQIRQDLSYFGQFGVKGVGYDVENLRRSLENILGLKYSWNLAIVGVGNLGRAIANYKTFSEMGFFVSALFDVSKELIGKKINGVKIYDSENLGSVAKRKFIDIGVITVPEDQAQKVVNVLVDVGVKGIWNFASTKIFVPPEVSIVNEDLAVGPTALSYNLSKN